LYVPRLSVRPQLPETVSIWESFVISKKHDFTIRGEHNAGNMLDSRHRRLSVMEVSHENHKHRYNFLRAADSSKNSWRHRQKAGEFGNHQGS
jgi:hypothetical protein